MKSNSKESQSPFTIIQKDNKNQIFIQNGYESIKETLIDNQSKLKYGG